jgi:adenine deaminase
MNTFRFRISGNIVDVIRGRIFTGTISVKNGKISSIEETANVPSEFILPGLIDAHIHIESSMLIPSEFARLAVVHGTVATVSDPHEIANVLGIDGIKFMIANGKKVPFKFNFGASSCVPATLFETSGGSIGLEETDELLKMADIRYLSEMMNFPGVIGRDPAVMKKIELAVRYGKPVDGHAPGLRGEDLRKYIEGGITTDHECFSYEEALEKIRNGMKILIREGSAAKNFEALSSLIEEFPDSVMFCSDDKHPNDLVLGHMNDLVRRAVAKGYDIMKVLKCCTVNPVRHYNLEPGLLQQGDDADFILVDNLHEFNVHATYIRGEKVAENGISLIKSVHEKPLNFFNATSISKADIRVSPEHARIKVLKAMDGQLITKELIVDARIENDNIVSNPDNDILKMIVKNRYLDAPPAAGFVTGFGLKTGAIASCVAHDSHNIIAVGADDESITRAVNLVISSKGGISLVDGKLEAMLELPVAGIMSNDDGYKVASIYDRMDGEVKKAGSLLNAPYMTLSFMALLVIPELKLSDKGLFDGQQFKFTGLFEK